MNKQQAQQLIKDTFENSFDRERYIHFLRELLNSFDGEGARANQGGRIFTDFQDYVKKIERVGKYVAHQSEVMLFIVYLKRKTSIERARTTLRSFVARYLSVGNKDAALVAYVSPDQADWRFSLVKMDYKFEKTATGKMKVKEEFTPARRWSFLVGVNEKSHTAQSRLVNILADDEHNPTLAELEEAFNIETVTKEFFLKYRALFLRTKEALDKVVKKDSKVEADFDAKGVDTVNFAKKLLGQIVFLYFLQKKGWFGVGRDDDWGTGPKQFLRELFEGKHVSYQNFFNDILEPLFYEALRIDRSHDDHYYSRFNCKIPFLNGGLFDPISNYDWVHTDINLPNDLFSNRTEDSEGTGILDIFDLFNFTVREDEPLEKEVAIDPELLGKAYEKFNAIRPDNFAEFKKALKSGRKGAENKFNKKFGVYYTPREIVHYMCKQSLINYLYTQAEEAGLSSAIKKQDIEYLIEVGEMITEHEATALIKEQNIKNGIQKSTKYLAKLSDGIRQNAKIIDDWLADITVCDPAVGSGAFPVGMMNEIVRARNVLWKLQRKDERSDYEFKRRCIEHSLYGVDIDPGAVEIAKLRLWLSLVVDEEDIKNIKPLPNLDYRIMQGNSLISEFMGINFDDEQKNKGLMFKDEIDDLIERFQKKKEEFLNESNVSQKAKLKDEVEQLLIEIFESKLKKQKGDFFNRLKNIEQKYSVLPNKQQRDELVQQEKDKLYKESGFDLEQTEKKLKEFTSGRQIKPFFLWKLYFSEVFHNKGGFDVVIANPPYIGEKDHKQIFREVKKGFLGKVYMGKMDYFYFFFHLSLNIAKDKATVSFITTNYYPTATGGKKLRQDFKKRAIIKNLMNFNELKIFESALGQHNMITILQKGHAENEISKTCITQRQGLATQEVLQQILNGRDKETQYYQVSQKDLYDGNNYYIRLEGVSNSLNNPIQKVLYKIKSQGVPLGSICNVNQGIVTGADKVSRRHIKKYGIKANVGDGIFVLSDDEIRNLNLTKQDKEILKPWFKNSDIFRWGTNSVTNKNILYLDRKRDAICKYIKDYLQNYREILKERREVKNGVIQWWQLQWPREKSIFESVKIVAPQRSPRNTFGYNEIPWYAASDVFFITEKGKSVFLKYILALINSKLYYFWLYHRGKRKGETLELIAKPLSEIPIKKIPENEQKPFVDIVDKILAITKDDDYLQNPQKQARVKELEREIDQLVYQLYGLTEEEIRIVEGEGK